MAAGRIRAAPPFWDGGVPRIGITHIPGVFPPPEPQILGFRYFWKYCWRDYSIGRKFSWPSVDSRWADRRGGRRSGGCTLHHSGGCRACCRERGGGETSQLQKVLWLKRRRPEIYAKTRKIRGECRRLRRGNSRVAGLPTLGLAAAVARACPARTASQPAARRSAMVDPQVGLVPCDRAVRSRAALLGL
jgi:hypothetical protein